MQGISVHVKVDKELKKYLDEEAKSRGMSVAGYIRMVLMAEKAKKK